MLGETTSEAGGHEETEVTVRQAATALSDAIRTTLGPNGMDKMVVGENGTVVVTNDGSKILDWMEIDHPVGRLVERIAAAQDNIVGDGTTTTVVLAGALLDEAATLREDGLHPTTIVAGYNRALTTVANQLEQYELEIQTRYDDRLSDVARTAVTGRWDDDSTERFADLTLDALRTVDFDSSKLTLKSYAGGELRESKCVDGLVVDLESSSTSLEGAGHARIGDIDDPAIAMVDGEIGIPEPDHVQSVQFENASQREAFQSHEREVREMIVERVTNAGAAVLCSQKSIDESIQTALVQHGVLPVERTRRDEFDVIARATGSTPVTSVEDLTTVDTGTVELVQQQTVGTTETLWLRGCPDEQRVSLLLRGGTSHVADEIRRIITDCIDVTRVSLDTGMLLPGGGAVPSALSIDLSTSARGISDRRQLVFDGFASALEAVPRTLAENAGANPLDVLATLKQQHDAGTATVGVGPDGRPCEMVEAGILEPSTVFTTALQRAVAVATMILRVDDLVRVGTDDTAATGHDDHDHGHAATGGYPWAVGH